MKRIDTEADLYTNLNKSQLLENLTQPLFTSIKITLCLDAYLLTFYTNNTTINLLI